MFQNSPGKSSGVTTSTVPAGTVIPGMTTLPVFRPLNPSAGRVQLSNPTLTTNSDGNLVLSVKLPANLAPGLPSAKIIPQGGGSECIKELSITFCNLPICNFLSILDGNREMLSKLHLFSFRFSYLLCLQKAINFLTSEQT